MLLEVLSANVGQEEAERAVAQLNPTLYLLSQQSRDLAQLRRELLVEGFGHTHLQEVLQALMAEQGKAERIKNFPFPRQYATVNSFFAILFEGLPNDVPITTMSRGIERDILQLIGVEELPAPREASGSHQY